MPKQINAHLRMTDGTYVGDDPNSFNTVTTGGTPTNQWNTIFDTTDWCPYLLPCGDCLRTYMPCHKHQPAKYEVTSDTKI